MGPNALSLFDYFIIMTVFCPSPNFSSHRTRLSAGLIHRDTIVFNLLPGFAKIAPWCLARRDRFVAKVPGLVVGVTAPPTLSAHTRNRYSECSAQKIYSMFCKYSGQFSQSTILKLV